MITTSKSMFRVSLFTALLTLATFSPAVHAVHAQDVGTAVQVNVPFGFETATGEHFSPGIYTLQMQNQHTLLIKGATETGYAMSMPEDTAQPAKSGNARFHKYGSTYFLSAINIAGQSRRIYLAPSKREKQMQVGGNLVPAGTIELALMDKAR